MHSTGETQVASYNHVMAAVGSSAPATGLEIFEDILRKNLLPDALSREAQSPEVTCFEIFHETLRFQ